MSRIKDIGIAVGVAAMLTFVTAGLAWSGECASGVEATVPEAVMKLHNESPKDQVYVIEGNEFKEFMRAVTALAGNPMPETALAQVNMAIVSDGPGTGSPGSEGAGIFLFHDTCMVFSILVDSQMFLDAVQATAPDVVPVPDLDQVPADGATSAKPARLVIPGARQA